MKKINLRGISETLGEKELKNVTGGIYNSDTLGSDELHDFDGGGGGEIVGSPKEDACKDKKEYDRCAWTGADHVLHSGRCLSFMGQPLHCSNLP